MQRLVVLTLAASTLSAQFSELAVTDDGRLYFTTALNTTGNDRRSKVYQFTGDGLSLYAGGGEFSNTISGPTASSPLVSGDGSVSGYARYYPCVGSCMIFVPRATFFLCGAGPERITADNLQVSRNGRFLLGLSSQVRRAFPDVAGLASSSTQDSFHPSFANNGALLFRDASAQLSIAP